VTTSVQRSLWVNGLWLAVLLAVVLTLVAGSAYRLLTARAKADHLNQSVTTAQLDASQIPDIDKRRAELEAAELTLARWSELVDSESARISDLSQAARAAGVTLVSLGSFKGGKLDAGRVLTSSHELVCLGGFQQLARFLHAVYLSRGMLAVDDLRLQPAPREGRHVLRASMKVIWNGPGPGPDLSPDAQVAG